MNPITELSIAVAKVHQQVSQSADLDPNYASDLEDALKLAAEIRRMVDFREIYRRNEEQPYHA